MRAAYIIGVAITGVSVPHSSGPHLVLVLVPRGLVSICFLIIDSIRKDIITDAAGNIIVTGFFSRTVDFDPGPGTFTMTSPPNNEEDVFIAKYSDGKKSLKKDK